MFAIWFKPFREALGFSQAECADLAGVAFNQWERWDNARNSPRPISYKAIAKGLGYASWQDWCKDFQHFAATHPEYVDTPWTDEMGKPSFTRRYGAGVLKDGAEIIHDSSQRTYDPQRQMPLPLVIERLANLQLDRIPSKSKRDELQKRHRNLVQRALVLEDDLLQLRSAAEMRQPKPRKK